MTTAPHPAGAESATLGGGCYWCLETVFDDLQGVTAVESGYTGGAVVKAFRDPVVTEVVSAQSFYVAEDYHLEYFVDNDYQPHCRFVVAPKVARFRMQFAHRVKPQ